MNPDRAEKRVRGRAGQTRAALADPAIAAEDRAKVAAELAALPLARCIDEERAASLLKEEAW